MTERQVALLTKAGISVLVLVCLALPFFGTYGSVASLILFLVVGAWFSRRPRARKSPPE